MLYKGKVIAVTKQSVLIKVEMTEGRLPYYEYKKYPFEPLKFINPKVGDWIQIDTYYKPYSIITSFKKIKQPDENIL